MYQPGAIVVCGGADSLSGDKLGCFNLSLKVIIFLKGSAGARQTAGRGAAACVPGCKVCACRGARSAPVGTTALARPGLTAGAVLVPSPHDLAPARSSAGPLWLHRVPGATRRAHHLPGRRRLHHAQRRSMLVLRDGPAAGHGARGRVRRRGMRGVLCGRLWGTERADRRRGREGARGDGMLRRRSRSGSWFQALQRGRRFPGTSRTNGPPPETRAAASPSRRCPSTTTTWTRTSCASR